MLSPRARRARRLDGPGAQAAPRPRAGVLVLSFGGPRRGALIRWVLMTALATGASCCLALAVAWRSDTWTSPDLAAADPETGRAGDWTSSLGPSAAVARRSGGWPGTWWRGGSAWWRPRGASAT
jgi:hypothetical protein